MADSGSGIRQSFATTGSPHCNATVRAEVEPALEHGIERVNALPEVAGIRRRVAERVGAAGTDAYSLLSRIGRDCVGHSNSSPRTSWLTARVVIGTRVQEGLSFVDKQILLVHDGGGNLRLQRLLGKPAEKLGENGLGACALGGGPAVRSAGCLMPSCGQRINRAG